MRLIVRLDPKLLRQWHLRAVQRLARRPHTELGVEWTHAGETLPFAAVALAAAERRVHRLPRGDALAAATAAEFAPFIARKSFRADLVLDLCNAGARPDEPTWQLRFDGAKGEAAIVGALTQSRTPVVAVVDASNDAEIVSGHPGTQGGRALVNAFDDVMARTMTLIAAALDGAARRHAGDRPDAAIATNAGIARFAIKGLCYEIISQVYRRLFFAPHWRIGWRFVDDADLVDLRALPASGWRVLPDDRVRFYSDPFPVAKDGRTYVFVEDLDHRVGRGVISVVEFDASGPIGAPRPVLDTGSHLSYPFVFEHRGDMWMIPESCCAGTIDLYRAERFPDGWVKQATLVEGVVASDATPFEHAGRWWMFATVQTDGGCHSDALHIWSAPDLLGPWTPHRRNPVLVDLATARPAGRVIRRDGKLIRPFQDCRNGYGAALGLAEITRLDDDGFEQRVETLLRPGPLWPGRKLHTLNRAGRLECIDGSAWSSKVLQRLRPGRQTRHAGTIARVSDRAAILRIW